MLAYSTQLPVLQFGNVAEDTDVETLLVVQLDKVLIFTGSVTSLKHLKCEVSYETLVQNQSSHSPEL